MKRSTDLLRQPFWFMLGCALLSSACEFGQSDSHQAALPDPDKTSPANAGSAPLPLSPFEDLEGDTLIPPEQPELSISAGTGSLNLHWTPVEGQVRARLFVHDPLTGGETLTLQISDPSLRHWQLPSHTHYRAWHRQQYRLELCTVDDCVSSARVSLSGLAAETVDSLSPAVFLKGERYAEAIALNQDASLAVLSLPLEGSLDIQARIDEQWSSIQSVSLEGLDISSTRTIQVSLSDSGDTLAVFIRDPDRMTPQIRILERLGEAWQEIVRWSLPERSDPVDSEPVRPQELPVSPGGALHDAITLSTDVDQLLLQHEGALMSFRQTDKGWSSTAWPVAAVANVPADSEASLPTDRLLASAASADMSRVFSVSKSGHLLYLDIWTAPSETSHWTRAARLELQGLDPDSALALASNGSGSAVSVAGWEDSTLSRRFPVMWRHAIEATAADNPTGNTFAISATDSLRAPPVEHPLPRLIFAADAALNIMALGWHSMDDAQQNNSSLPDAALSTYVFDTPSRQWLSALELPENLPTLAKQSFATELVLSPDGSTLMMTNRQSRSQPLRHRAGQALIMR